MEGEVLKVVGGGSLCFREESVAEVEWEGEGSTEAAGGGGRGREGGRV